MTNSLPSYLQATTKDHWSLISSFVASQDLCSAALVSRQWNQVFVPHLWGNPASHFGTENDEVYIALVRFKRTLSWARVATRELTHTLCLPPAHAELYDGPRAEWLRDILLRLPRLQSLIVSGLPFFDHGALTGLISTMNGHSDSHKRDSTFSLRLLEASRAYNATSSSLAQALSTFTALTYLDLSHTPSAKDTRVFQAFHLLQGLQVLKLRGIGLGDEDLHSICKSVRLRLRSLDISDNKVTDKGISYILQDCIIPASRARDILRRNLVYTSGLTSGMHEYYGLDLPQVFTSGYQDRIVRSRYVSGFCHQVGFEDAIGTGITHLYISGNAVSVSIVADALRMQRLHVLDTGMLLPEIKTVRLSRVSQWQRTVTGVEGLTPVLETTKNELTYLRSHYALITQFVTPQPTSEAPAELEGDPVSSTINGEVDVPAMMELEGTNSVHELSAESAVFEMEGSPVPASLLPARTPEMGEEFSEIPRPSPSRTPSTNAPEVLVDEALISPLPRTRLPRGVSPSPVRNDSLSPHIASPLAPLTPVSPPSPASVTSLERTSTLAPVNNAPVSRARTWSGVLSDRDARLSFIQSQPHALLPSMVPALRTLVLTDVPLYSNCSTISDRIIAFITACAEQEYWAKLQARYAYSLPPGRDRVTAEQSYASSLFALKNITLEMGHERSPTHNHFTRTESPHNGYRSMAEDPDCEALWTASEGDFSFFGQEANEECGVLETEARRPTLASQMGKMLVDEPTVGHQPISTNPSDRLVDTLARLSSFRTLKKQEYATALARGDVDPCITGFWSGVITVIRPK